MNVPIHTQTKIAHKRVQKEYSQQGSNQNYPSIHRCIISTSNNTQTKTTHTKVQKEYSHQARDKNVYTQEQKAYYNWQ